MLVSNRNPAVALKYHTDEQQPKIFRIFRLFSAIFFYQVALHELGHIFGLNHSTDQSAVMAAYYRYNANVQLATDDIQGIQALYGGMFKLAVLFPSSCRLD